jgi:hypothetical protein
VHFAVCAGLFEPDHPPCTDELVADTISAADLCIAPLAAGQWNRNSNQRAHYAERK